MKQAYEIVSCQPDDAIFSAMLPGIYGSDFVSSGNEIDKNYLQKCLVISGAEEVLGRICIYRNDALHSQGKRVALFGNFECINDASCASALLDYGIDFAESDGAAFVIGPMNGSTWNQYRFISLRGDAPTFFTEQSQPDYYPELWRAAGFTPFQEYVSNLAEIPEEASFNSTFFADHGLIVRDIDVKHLQEELAALYPLCMAAFAQNPLYTPISQEQFAAKLMVLQPLLAGSFTKIVADSIGKPVGFILCLPNINDRQGKSLVLKTAARHPECNIPGLISELYRTAMSEAIAGGYRHIIHAFMHVDNRSVLRSQQFAGKTIRRYTLYIHSC